MPVIYLDVVWLLNFVLDGFILLATGFLARRPMKVWRMIGASAIGASYALFLFIPAMSAFLSFFCKILFSLLMVWVAFAPKGRLEFLKMVGLFYLASFVTGGAAYGLNGFFKGMTMQNGLLIVGGDTVWSQQTQVLFVLLAVPVVWFLGKSAWHRLARAKHREQNLWQVDVLVEGQTVTLTGLLDTGNALADPLSRTPVMVVDGELFQEVLPAELTQHLAGGDLGDLTQALDSAHLSEAWQSRLRVVPYRGVGGSTGLLLAFRPDEVRLRPLPAPHAAPEAPDPTMAPARCTTRVLVGLNPRALAADRSYRAILHPAMTQDLDMLTRKEQIPLDAIPHSS